MCSSLQCFHRQIHSCINGTWDSEIPERKCFMLLVQLLRGSTKQTQHWWWNPGLHTGTRRVFLLTPLLPESYSPAWLISLFTTPPASKERWGYLQDGDGLSLFLQKVKSLLETIKCKYPVFNQDCPRQSFNSCLYLPFKNKVWLICIIFRGRIVRFYYTMGTTVLCLYTKNIIRKEIIQTTNPPLVWETVSVKLWRRFQIFSFGRPNTEQTSWTAWAYWWAQVRQRPEKRNKKDKSTLTNTVCLVLFFDTRAKWCGIAWIHSINLTYLPTPWGYLTCLWRMVLALC